MIEASNPTIAHSYLEHALLKISHVEGPRQNIALSDNKYKVYYFIQLQQQHIAICPLWFEKIYGRTNGQVPYSGNCAPAGSQIAK